MMVQKPPRIQSRSGMTLIQVLIALALTGVVAAVMSSIFVNSVRSSEYVSAKYSFLDLMGQINTVIGSNSYCPTAFNNGTPSSPAPLTISSSQNSANVGMIVQKIGTQSILVAQNGQKLGSNSTINSIELQAQKDVNGVPVQPILDSPSSGQVTHMMNLVVTLDQSSGFGVKQISNTLNPIALTIVTDKTTGAIVSCSTAGTGGAGAVIWSKTITSPTYPLPAIDIPPGTKGIKIDVTSFQVIQLPGDHGRTVGSRFNYATNGGHSGTFAVSEIGAGNNNGAQARFTGTTTGVIPVYDEDTQLTVSRQGYVLDQNGNPMGTAGAVFQGESITFMGLDKAPESPPPPPPPTGPLPPGYGGGGGGGCFVAGTKIQLANGHTKNIEDILPGDEVLSFDEVTKIPLVEKVTRLHHHPANDQLIHHFLMADGETLTSNGIHPIFVVEKGAYFQAAQIAAMWNAGARISFLRADGAVIALENIQLEKKFVPVYNFEVEGLFRNSPELGSFGLGHNYYAEGFLVHNAIYGSSLAKILQLNILGVPSYAMKARF
jgi:type II secretory pathway pseudopilin PulG